MAYLGKNQPVISGVVNNGNELFEGQVIIFGPNAAMSGIVTGFGDPGIAIVNPQTGQLGCIIRSDGIYSFGSDARAGIISEFNGTQTSLYHNSQRILYATNLGINLGEKRIDGFRRRTINRTSDLSVTTQDTGTRYTNIGATGVVTITLNSTPTDGHNFSFNRVADFPLRIVPAAGDAIIMPTGQLPDGDYIELGNVGAFVELMANSQDNWMVISSGGTITPE